MKGFWRILPILAIGAALWGMATPADAAFRLRLDSGGGTGVVITDGGPGDLSTDPGVIVFVGAVGGFNINVTTGISKPQIGGVTNFAELHLNSVNVSTTTGGTLRIFLEDDGYTGGDNGPQLLVANFGGVMTAPAGSSITAQSWVNPNNLVPNYGGNQATQGTITPAGTPTTIPAGSVAAWPGAGVTFTDTVTGDGGIAFSSTASAGFIKNGPYSLFGQVNIFLSGGGSVSFDETQEVVPAPAGLILLATGLPFLGVGAYIRRRMKKAKA